MESWSKGYPSSAMEMWTDASGSWMRGDLTTLILLDTIAMFLLEPCRSQPKKPKHIMERDGFHCVSACGLAETLVRSIGDDTHGSSGIFQYRTQL